MDSHEKFKLKILAAPKDVSLPILLEMQAEKYTDTLWRTSAGATDAPCIAKNGDQEALDAFVSGLMYEAPIFEKTHVGCQCGVEVIGEGLPTRFVTAFGEE